MVKYLLILNSLAFDFNVIHYQYLSALAQNFHLFILGFRDYPQMIPLDFLDYQVKVLENLFISQLKLS